MRLITVRHGRTRANDLRVTQGWSDEQLDSEGIEQVKKVSERLKDEKIEIIFASDLQRAYKTAEEISKHHDCKIIKDKRLREQGKGKYENGPAKVMIEDFKKSSQTIVDWTPEGGESIGEVNKRVMDFLEEVIRNYKNKTVLIVSHGGPLAVISRNFKNDSKFDPDDKENNRKHSHKNTGISEYTFDGENWNIIKYNCIKHLE